MEKDKILSAIYGYKHLLADRDALTQPPELVGNIWHNLGTAYARLFLFDEAIACFHQAYVLNQNEASRREELLAYRCKRDENGFIRAGIEYGMDETQLQEIRNELTLASRSEELEAFEEELEKLARQSDTEGKAVHNARLMEIISKWKADYRHISRI